ncbi:hypothetical protein L2E82_29883 [Cichorium intybus]|uniref:Uncharacterized protein n=1 Tax=Cichorium intybus TaxID=13427 RepID=A0ACB9CYQ1_CICIN|nr:hypothetical protein L2E82_29883 [Cichorium intybus]
MEKRGTRERQKDRDSSPAAAVILVFDPKPPQRTAGADRRRRLRLGKIPTGPISSRFRVCSNGTMVEGRDSRQPSCCRRLEAERQRRRRPQRLWRSSDVR